MKSSATLVPDAPEIAPLAPTAPGSGLRNAINLYHHPIPMFVQWHREAGPICRFRALGREFLAMSGPEANLLLKEQDGAYFRSYEVFFRAGKQLHQQDHFISQLDGEAHRQQRRILQPGFDHAAVTHYYPRMCAAAEQVIRTWKPGQRLSMTAAMQSLVCQQLGFAMVHHKLGKRYKDAVTFSKFLNGAAIAGTWPAVLLAWPTYLLAKWRMEARMRRLIKERRAQGPNEQEPDLLDLTCSRYRV